jgi:hypothetical protein
MFHLFLLFYLFTYKILYKNFKNCYLCITFWCLFRELASNSNFQTIEVLYGKKMLCICYHNLYPDQKQ